MTQEQRIWIIAETKDDGSLLLSAYDNEADAENFYAEMKTRCDCDKVRKIETALNRREEEIPTDDNAWGAQGFGISQEFVEGLMEDMVSLDEIRPGAANRFVCEKIDMVRRRTRDRFDEIVKDETRKELLACRTDWCLGKVVED